MALLKLKDVGKIYVSGENIAVGIRGVNLSFRMGEFVAITGKSGSGKSTLLNVISGMDSYEEGEIYIEDEPTSHYSEADWEEYRKDYISFIFQDYNIIESFTVLENVELALMDIEDKAERRKRALDLIDRVGLTSHVSHKGSRLSGGQKQRTVIARALAKNSPIILADEPTGNLDSKTSKEIIELLHEVSKEKLVIVVTHNFDDFEEYATRHIRIFDGAVESDHEISAPGVVNAPTKKAETDKKTEIKKNIKDGFTLGRAIFTSKPKLSLFLCLLMIIGTIGVFLITSLCGEAAKIFEPHYMFNNIEGRVVVTTANGTPLSEKEIKKIVEDYGADSYLRYDILLDVSSYNYAEIHSKDEEEEPIYFRMNCVYGESFGDDIVGRYPEKANEVFLYLPIYYRDEVGKHEITADFLYFSKMNLEIVGVKYYYDNNLTPKCLFTEEGFRTATAIYYLMNSGSYYAIASIDTPSDYPEKFSEISLSNIFPSFDIPSDKIYVVSSKYNSYVEALKKQNVAYATKIEFFSSHYNGGDYYGDKYYGDINIEMGGSSTTNFKHTFTDSDITSTKPDFYADYAFDNALVISDELIREIAESTLDSNYKQASLFFSSQKDAKAAAEKLCDAGYIAVTADTTYEPDAMDTIIETLEVLVMAALWFVAIIFLAFFINLCSSKVLMAFKSDMAIMRSMGIAVNIIRIGMYVRMLISLIPAFIMLALTAVLIFTIPACNEFFVYLYFWQYALMAVGIILLCVRVTYKQIAKLFGESVKKSLKGGAEE